MKRILPALLAAATLGGVCAPAHADEMAVDLNSGSLYVRGTFQNFGWAFSLSKAVKITALGIYDFGADGLVDVHQLGLWDASHALIATALVDSSNALTADAGGGWRFQSIAPLVLAPGDYVLGAHYTTVGEAGDRFVGQAGFTLADGLTFLDSRVTVGAVEGFAEPVSSSSFGAPGYFGPNMLVTAVPEPASWAMMVGGIGLLGAALRRRPRLAPAGLPA